MKNMTNILARKTRNFHTISPLAAVKDALSQMCCENVDHLVVMDNQRFMGILTEHDITTKGMSANKSFKKQLVKDIMNNSLPVVTVYDSVDRCMKLMRQHNVRHIPVFDDFAFAGIISSDDIIEEVMFGGLKLEHYSNEESDLYAS